jgi:hypothetical protein
MVSTSSSSSSSSFSSSSSLLLLPLFFQNSWRSGREEKKCIFLVLQIRSPPWSRRRPPTRLPRPRAQMRRGNPRAMQGSQRARRMTERGRTNLARRTLGRPMPSQRRSRTIVGSRARSGTASRAPRRLQSTVARRAGPVMSRGGRKSRRTLWPGANRVTRRLHPEDPPGALRPTSERSQAEHAPLPQHRQSLPQKTTEAMVLASPAAVAGLSALTPMTGSRAVLRSRAAERGPQKAWGPERKGGLPSGHLRKPVGLPLAPARTSGRMRKSPVVPQEEVMVRGAGGAARVGGTWRTAIQRPGTGGRSCTDHRGQVDLEKQAALPRKARAALGLRTASGGRGRTMGQMGLGEGPGEARRMRDFEVGSSY